MIPVWVIALLAALGAVCLALPLHIGMTGVCLLLLAAVLLALRLLKKKNAPKHWSRLLTGLTAADYDAVGYGYIMGSSEQNGTWQVFFVKGNNVVSTVNLDARDATILLVEPDEEGNG